MNDPQPPHGLRDCWPTDGCVHDVQTHMLQMFCKEKTKLPGRPPVKLNGGGVKLFHALQKIKPFSKKLAAQADILYFIIFNLINVLAGPLFKSL